MHDFDMLGQVSGGGELTLTIGDSGHRMAENLRRLGMDQFRPKLFQTTEQFQSLLYKVREDRVAEMASDATRDPAAQLEAITRLHREGVLTDEEYEEKRQKLVDQM